MLNFLLAETVTTLQTAWPAEIAAYVERDFGIAYGYKVNLAFESLEEPFLFVSTIANNREALIKFEKQKRSNQILTWQR